MALNYEQLLQDMLNAAKSVLSKKWNDAAPFAEVQFKSFTQNIELIANLKLSGKISEDAAKAQLNLQKHAMQVVLLAMEGLGILAVESAINAAIDVIRNTVNKTIGWSIL